MYYSFIKSEVVSGSLLVDYPCILNQFSRCKTHKIIFYLMYGIRTCQDYIPLPGTTCAGQWQGTLEQGCDSCTSPEACVDLNNGQTCCVHFGMTFICPRSIRFLDLLIDTRVNDWFNLIDNWVKQLIIFDCLINSLMDLLIDLSTKYNQQFIITCM